MSKEFTTPYDQHWDFRWTIDRYHQAIETGALSSQHKVELLFGRVWEKHPPADRIEGDNEYQWPLEHYQLIVSTQTITEE